MAVKLIRRASSNVPWEYIGLSTDTKPTEDVPAGSTFLELDGEKDIYMFDGTNWVVM